MSLFLVAVHLLIPANPTGSDASVNINQPIDTLRVFCTEDQHHLTCQWMKDFHKDHSGLHTEVLLYKRSKALEKSSLGKNDFALVPDSHSKHIQEECWCIKYARDGIVGIINIANPCGKEIMESGLDILKHTRIQTGEKYRSWIKDPGPGPNSPMKVFICSDTFSACNLLADYLKMDPDELRIIMTAGADDMIDSVRLDPLSMGLCCQRYAYDLHTKMETAKIKIVPLDSNANGIIDDKEGFYDNLDELQRAMWTGRYPCHAFLNHYIVATRRTCQSLTYRFHEMDPDRGTETAAK